MTSIFLAVVVVHFHLTTHNDFPSSSTDKWLLQFGCTQTGYQSNGRFGNDECQFDYGTIERDLIWASALALGLAAASLTVLAAYTRERR